jgi:hypothetical protein
MDLEQQQNFFFSNCKFVFSCGLEVWKTLISNAKDATTVEAACLQSF